MSSFIDHRGDGSNKSFLIPFEYYENDQLFAYVDDRLVEIEQYNKNSIVLKDIPPSGSLVRIRRIVDVDTPFATYITGSDLTEDTLNKNNLKLLYGIQQLNDGFVDDDFYFKKDISMGDNRIIDVADGIDDTDAVNYSQVKNLDTNVKQIEQNIIRLEQQAKASKDAASVSETNAKTSETNAKVSETNAKESELLAKASKDAAKISETNAKDSELLAKQYEDAAKISETNAKTSETNSKTSETNAKESELLAKASKDAAGVSENNAKQYADAAKVSETNAKVSETNAKESELLAKQYAAESKSTKPDYKTIFIDTAGNIAAKDLVINGDEDDLASGRGQIGKCYSLTSSIDFNTLFKSGRYWFTNAIFAECSNKPPVNVGGFCDVLGEESGNSYTKQIYHVYNSPVIYIREHKGTTEGWNETWTRIITEKNLATTFAPGIVQLNNTTSSTSTSQAATAKAVKTTYDKVLEVETKADEALTKTVLPLGHIYLWPFSTPPDGSIQVNGSEYNRELYSDLWALIQAKGWYKPESEWQQIASANGGYCPWYSDGDGSTTFRTPKFAPYQKLALASGDAGIYTAEGLPNITGKATYINSDGIDEVNYPDSGALTWSDKSYSRIYSSLVSGTGKRDLVFNASLSNPIYSNSDHVTPESHDWIVCVVAFGTATNVGSVDVANVMSAVGQVQAVVDQVQADVATKLDNDTIRVIETWKSTDSASWYRKYSDGFIEQGGNSQIDENTDKDITLSYPFSSTVYQVVVTNTSGGGRGDTEGYIFVKTKYTSSIKFSASYLNPNTSSFNWYACGY